VRYSFQCTASVIRIDQPAVTCAQIKTYSLPLSAILILSQPTTHIHTQPTHHTHAHIINTLQSHPPKDTNEKMSYPFTALPCALCKTYTCTDPFPGHGLPVMIALSHASRADLTTAGLFCGEKSPFNTVYILHDGGDKVTRREAILHTAAMAVNNVACFLAGNPGESATGSAAIRVILLKVDIPDFVEWWGKTGEERGVVSARCAELLRDLEDAAALVGECGEYRPEVRFVLPTNMLGEPGVGFAAERSVDQ
jgi:hypothetical protein